MRRRERVAIDGEVTAELHVDRLALIDVAALEAEAGAVGLEPAGRVEVAPSEAHVGSTVAMLEAAR
jgi:hypothetical protein